MSGAPPRVGVLGGRFDPVHRGHLATAAAARRRLRLDRVLMLPSRLSPHRKRPPGADGADRLAMVALAARDDPSLEPCDLELAADEPSYTAATLRRLHVRGHPPTSLFFIVGADAFADITAWHDYPRLLDAAHFVVVSRPGHPVASLPDALPALRPRLRAVTDDAGPQAGGPPHTPAVFLLDADTPDISSTDIRARLGEGRPLGGRVPRSVAEYIDRRGLYRPAAEPGVAPRPEGAAGTPARPPDQA